MGFVNSKSHIKKKENRGNRFENIPPTEPVDRSPAVDDFLGLLRRRADGSQDFTQQPPHSETSRTNRVPTKPTLGTGDDDDSLLLRVMSELFSEQNHAIPPSPDSRLMCETEDRESVWKRVWIFLPGQRRTHLEAISVRANEKRELRRSTGRSVAGKDVAANVITVVSE